MPASFRLPLRHGLAPGALALALAGCATSAPEPTCPATKTVPNAGRLVAFAEGKQTPGAVRFAARVRDMAVRCERVERGGAPKLAARLKLRLRTRRGPALRQPRASYRYFVAVMNPEGEVLGRRAFKLNVDFSGGGRAARTTETITQTLPLPEQGQGKRHVIYVGFELSKKQLRYNRRNAR